MVGSIFIDLVNSPATRHAVVSLVHEHCLIEREQYAFRQGLDGQMEFEVTACRGGIELQELVEMLKTIPGVLSAYVTDEKEKSGGEHAEASRTAAE